MPLPIASANPEPAAQRVGPCLVIRDERGEEIARRPLGEQGPTDALFSWIKTVHRSQWPADPTAWPGLIEGYSVTVERAR